MYSDEQRQNDLNLGVCDKLLSILDLQQEALADETKLNRRGAVLREACWMISNITAGTKEQIDYVIKNNFIFPSLINLLKHAPFTIRKQATWAINKVAIGNFNKLSIW